MPEKTAVYPLSGIRVLAVEHFRLGPTGTMMLADAGAEVIKIEPPGVGEQGRTIKVRSKEGKMVPFLLPNLNRNKKSLALNLRHERGRELFKELVKLSDVVWENMRPHVLAGMGLGYQELRQLNPRLIYVSVTGFGHPDIYPSPYSDWPAFDAIGQAMSGFMYSAGDKGRPPAYSTAVLADTVPSILAAYGALLALQMRERTGLGQHVDMSMYDGMVFLMNYGVAYYAITGSEPPRGEVPTSAPMGAYRARDGYLVLGVGGEPMWQRFCQVLGREDLLHHPQLSNGFERARNNEEVLRPIIEGWLADKTVSEAYRFLMERGVPAAPVQTIADLFRCPHLESRNMLVPVEDPEAGVVRVAGNPVKLSAVPEKPARPAPGVGQHTHEVLGQLLGLSPAEIQELQGAGVI